MPSVWPRCGWTEIGRRICSRRGFTRVEVWRVVISQVQPRDPGRGGAVPRAAGLQPLPFLSHLCTFSVPFVNEGLVKPLQRKGRKNFFISVGACRMGMKVDWLIEGQNVFFGYFSPLNHRLGILELKETLEFI